MKFTIDCTTCLRQRSDSCDDCVVMFLTNREPDEAVVVDAAEFAALRRLSEAGLVPSLLHDTGPTEGPADGFADIPTDGPADGLRGVG
jgi:hypothetical protein